MENDRVTKKALIRKHIGTKRKQILKNRWIESVIEDLQKMNLCEKIKEVEGFHGEE